MAGLVNLFAQDALFEVRCLRCRSQVFVNHACQLTWPDSEDSRDSRDTRGLLSRMQMSEVQKQMPVILYR